MKYFSTEFHPFAEAQVITESFKLNFKNKETQNFIKHTKINFFLGKEHTLHHCSEGRLHISSRTANPFWPPVGILTPLHLIF